VDDGVGPAKRLDRLAVIRQLRAKERRLRSAGLDDVHVHDVVAVFDQVMHDRPSGLAAAAGDDDLRHRSHLIESMPVARQTVERVRRMFVFGFDADELRAPELQPRGERRGAPSGEELRFDGRPCLGVRDGRLPNHGFDARDVPAVLGLDGSHDRPGLSVEDRLLQGSCEFAPMDVAQQAVLRPGPGVGRS
jgi:hypothetical protein